MCFKLRPYKKSSLYSYALGVFPTLELLHHRALDVVRVLLSSKSEPNRGIAKIRELGALLGIDIRADDSAIARLTNAENCYAVGVFRKYYRNLSRISSHVVLVNPDDMGNLGTIARTMRGYGFRNLAIVEPAVDVFNPRAIRASMGALFQLRFARFPSFDDYWEQYAGRAYTFMTGGYQRLNAASFQEPCAFIFGNEGQGLPKQIARIGESVRIEQSNAIDSLNLGVAVGIALHQAFVTRNRLTHGEGVSSLQ
jgi:TrmH family RNA methyltransferase